MTIDQDPFKWKWGIYYNPDDPRSIVPKQIKSLGWTFNFAKPGAIIFTIILIVWVVFIIAYSFIR